MKTMRRREFAAAFIATVGLAPGCAKTVHGHDHENPPKLTNPPRVDPSAQPAPKKGNPPPPGVDHGHKNPPAPTENPPAPTGSAPSEKPASEKPTMNPPPPGVEHGHKNPPAPNKNPNAPSKDELNKNVSVENPPPPRPHPHKLNPPRPRPRTTPVKKK